VLREVVVVVESIFPDTSGASHPVPRGAVAFHLDATGIQVHADSMFANQTFDTRVPALVRGSRLTIEVSTRLLRRMLGR